MRLQTCVLLIAAAAAATMLAAAPGMAQSSQPRVRSNPIDPITGYPITRKEVRARTSVTVTKRSYLDPGKESKAPGLTWSSFPAELAARPVLRSDRELPALQQPQPVSELPRPSGLLPVGRASSSSVVMLPTKGHPAATAPEANAKGMSKPFGCWIARSTRAMTPRETNSRTRKAASSVLPARE